MISWRVLSRKLALRAVVILRDREGLSLRIREELRAIRDLHLPYFEREAWEIGEVLGEPPRPSD